MSRPSKPSLLSAKNTGLGAAAVEVIEELQLLTTRNATAIAALVPPDGRRVMAQGIFVPAPENTIAPNEFVISTNVTADAVLPIDVELIASSFTGSTVPAGEYQGDLHLFATPFLSRGIFAAAGVNNITVSTDTYQRNGRNGLFIHVRAVPFNLQGGATGAVPTQIAWTAYS